jgi:hypothetical protein
MRRIPLFLLFLATFIHAVSAQEYDRPYLEGRLAKFKSMRSGGFTMAGIGGAALLGGIVLASNGKYETVDTGTGTQANAKDGAAVGGILLIAVGVPLTVAGVILGSLGNRKVGQYQRRLEGLSLNLDLGHGHQGARLAYTF